MYPFSSRLAPQPSYDFTGLLAPRPAPVPRDPMIPLSQMNIPSGYATRAVAPVISAGMPDMPSTATSAPTPQPRGLFTGTGSSARLFSLGQSLLAPSRIPTTLGGRIASGLAAGQQAAAEQQKQELAKTLADLQRQEAELRMGKLERETKMLGVPKRGKAVAGYEKDTGAAVTLIPVETVTGTNYIDAVTNLPVDFQKIALGKPPAATSKKGTLYSYYEDGQRRVISDQSPDFLAAVQNYPDIAKVGTEQGGNKDMRVFESIDDPSKTIATWYNPRTNQRVDESGNPVDLTEFRLPPSVVPSFSDIAKAQKLARDAAAEMRQLGSFKGQVKTASFGIRGKLDDIKSAFLAATGLTKNMSEEQMARKLAQADQQGLIGRLKDFVVGGGVMTEQDAKRIIEYMGGDVSSIFANPVVILEAIEHAMKLRSADGLAIATEFNKLSKRSPDVDKMDLGIFNYVPEYLAPQSFLANQFTQQDWRQLSDEEKAPFLEEYK